MPTKKGKSKPAKAKKVSNKTRRAAPGRKTAGSTKTAKRSAATSKSATPRKKRAAGKLRRTEAGPVWIGSSPAPMDRPAEDRGNSKATSGESERVRIL